MDYFNRFGPRIDVDQVIKVNEELEEENKKLKKLLNDKILLVEDGSVDIHKLVEDGFRVISYRQGSTPPMWLGDKGE